MNPGRAELFSLGGLKRISTDSSSRSRVSEGNTCRHGLCPDLSLPPLHKPPKIAITTPSGKNSNPAAHESKTQTKPIENRESNKTKRPRSTASKFIYPHLHVIIIKIASSRLLLFIHDAEEAVLKSDQFIRTRETVKPSWAVGSYKSSCN